MGEKGNVVAAGSASALEQVGDALGGALNEVQGVGRAVAIGVGTTAATDAVNARRAKDNKDDDEDDESSEQ